MFFSLARKYLYRAADKDGRAVGFLLTARRDNAAAVRFLDKAIKASGISEKVTMDKIGVNKAPTDEINGGGETSIIGHPNQLFEQHR